MLNVPPQQFDIEVDHFGYNSCDFNKPNTYSQPQSYKKIIEICPSIYTASIDCLSDEMLQNHNFKVIINCSPTYKFLNELKDAKFSISTDILILSLDLGFDLNKFNDDEKALLDEFNQRFSKILQNYINFFVHYNDKFDHLIDKLPSNLNLNLVSPILEGNLKNNLFKVVRLIKLIKNINSTVDVLVLNDNLNNKVSASLLTGYLMDTYNYNVNASLNYLANTIPFFHGFNLNYYNDLLLLENLKKFYVENNEIKKGSTVLYNNKDRKRSCDADDEHDYVPSSGAKRRVFKYM